MAEVLTLNDVIDRMKREGDLNRNSGTNSIKSLKEELQTQTQLQINMMEKFDLFFDKMIADSLQAKMSGLKPVKPDDGLDDIEERTGVNKAKDKDNKSNIIILGSISKLIASLAAVAAALQGATTLKSIKTMGIALAKSVNKVLLGIPTKLLNGLKNLKIKFTGFMGKIGDTRFVKVLSSAWESFKVALGKFGDKIAKFFAPMTKFLSGGIKIPGGGIIETVSKSLGKVGGWIKGIFKFFGKVLYPLAVLFSAIDGTREAMKQYDASKDEGLVQNITKTLGGFTAGFIGSFFGGFFDLIKNGVNWVLKKVFPGFVDDNGKWKTDTKFGTIMGNIEEFSFAKFITDSINSVFGFVSDVFTWIEDKFGKIAEWLGFDIKDMDPTTANYKMTDDERKGAIQARNESGMNAPQYNKWLKNATDAEIRSVAESSEGILGPSDNEIMRGMIAERAKLNGYKPIKKVNKPALTKNEVTTQLLDEQTKQRSDSKVVQPIVSTVDAKQTDNSTTNNTTFGGGDTGLSAGQQAGKAMSTGVLDNF